MKKIPDLDRKITALKIAPNFLKTLDERAFIKQQSNLKSYIHIKMIIAYTPFISNISKELSLV